MLFWIRKPNSLPRPLKIQENHPLNEDIDGGGYSDFGASYSPRTWMKNNGNGFVFVEIQYRLGAFGYLSSAEVQQRGQLNAGLLDMRFALRWVQQHIRKFGGDPKKVTVAGESSGAGSAMYQALAYGGREGHLFNNVSFPSLICCSLKPTT